MSDQVVTVKTPLGYGRIWGIRPPKSKEFRCEWCHTKITDDEFILTGGKLYCGPSCKRENRDHYE